ncbi:MAG TPA: hypothetical protein VFA18_18750 [Gemmataceae bacterium]|nr:hypothetical protein [Gemmataceae bacterium]
MPKRWLAALALALPIQAALGCANHNADLVEAELRTKEDRLYQLQAELERAQGCNQALQQELAALRQNPACKVTPELASQLYTLKDIVLGRLTGGLDEDDCPGDEALQVVVEPRDCDGQNIKAPGSLQVTAFQITPEGLKASLSTWDVDPTALRKSWRGGLFGTGYYVVLPWKAWPTGPKLRVVARLTLADGRVYEADRDVTIHVTPAAYRKPGVPIAPEPPPLPVEPATPLPAPKPLEGFGPELGQSGTAPSPWQVSKDEPAVEVLKPRPIASP